MDGPETATTAPAVPDWASRRRFTVDTYHRMGEAGIVGPQDRIELIDGEIIEMAPIGSPHLGAVAALTRLLTMTAPRGVIISVQHPVQLGDSSEPEPDLALLRPRPDNYRTSPLPSAADVLLIVEVSDTSLRYDQEVKLPLYARHGIQELWIVDLAAGAVNVHRRPTEGRYADAARTTPGDTIEPLATPGVRISVADILIG